MDYITLLANVLRDMECFTLPYELATTLAQLSTRLTVITSSQNIFNLTSGSWLKCVKSQNAITLHLHLTPDNKLCHVRF